MTKIYKENLVPVINDIICDCCGKSCKVNDSPTIFEKASLHASWGYFSEKDGDIWHYDLCESCADEVKAFIESISILGR